MRNINTLDFDEDSPTLTADLLEIYFTTDRTDGGAAGLSDTWYATRSDRTQPFNPPRPLAAANSADEEVSPAISGDGLTLWVGSNRENGLGGFDIWRITRPDRDAEWGAIENVTALNSEADDLPRPLGQGARLMPFASRRAAAELQTFFAVLDDSRDRFQLVDATSSLSRTGDDVMDACVSEDGLSMFFNRSVAGQADLFFAWRRSLDDAFGDPTKLPTINSEFDESSPWLSADATRFFFSSNRRDGRRRDIYATSMSVPQFD